ncbi:hypothetical protein GQ55_5G168500 [Panicum hallii var. hallii]|uniref:Uncharacterized protein n=1 Tax=Panicum hallii var. hallii TaxID=1504633 RepID=A0A2T7DH39_9POAL|nr:hypothetical protein GQ55_5G168500 [Panicum hallii var. hallii]
MNKKVATLYPENAHSDCTGDTRKRNAALVSDWNSAPVPWPRLILSIVGRNLQPVHEVNERRRRRPADLQRGGGHILRHRRPLPELLPLPGLHDQPDLGLHLLRLHHGLVVALHHHPQLHPLRDEHLVQPLLRVHRPAHHRHPRRDRLQRRVPPAVRHERARRAVPQHLHLRRPRRHHQPAPARPVQEPLREQRLQRRLAPALEPLRRVGVGRDGRAHGPEERVPAPLEPRRDLPQLLRRHRARAAEAEEDHAPWRLRVQPRQALVLPLASPLLADQRPDAEQPRHGLAGAGAPLLDRLHGAGLQPLERVHQYPLRSGQLLKETNGGLVLLVARTKQDRRQVGRRDRVDAWEVQQGAPHVPERDVGPHDGDVQVGSERRGARREEQVGRESELLSGVERAPAEEVDDERLDGREGPHEREERGVGGAEVGDERDEGVGVGVGLVAGAGGRRREQVEGDGRVGGGEALDGLTGVAGRRDVGYGDGDGDAVAGQAAGELNHGVEVAPNHPCVQHHGAAHLLYVALIYVRSYQWGSVYGG